MDTGKKGFVMNRVSPFTAQNILGIMVRSEDIKINKVNKNR